MVNPAQDWPDFTRAMLLVGVDAAGDPVGVLVDSDGNLNAILKGQGATGLQTIAVDANGRIQVFVLDDENQWGDTLRIGNAELAGRLGSPVSWDWRGNVLLINTFGKGQGSIFHYHAGVGSSVTISPTTFLTDGFSLKCEGGNATGQYAGYDGRLGVNPSGRFGFALAWAPSGNFLTLKVSLWINVDGTAYLGQIQYTRASNTLAYLDSDGAYQTIGNPTYSVGTYAFNRIKLVVDLTAETYLRVLWNSQEYDLDAFPLRVFAGLAQGTLEYQLRVDPGAVAQAGVYVDHHIITVNEPINS